MQNKQLGHQVILIYFTVAKLKWDTKVNAAARDVTRLALQEVNIKQYLFPHERRNDSL